MPAVLWLKEDRARRFFIPVTISSQENRQICKAFRFRFDVIDRPLKVR